MKKLGDVVNLIGLLEEINMMDLRARPGEILTQVSLGKTFLIKRTGKPLAFLSYLPSLGKPHVEITMKINRSGKVSYSL